MGYLFYNIKTDTAFRVESEYYGTTWFKEVSTTKGRAKMNASRKFMATGELSELIAKGIVFKLYDAKTVARDINFIRADKTPPQPEPKTTKRKADKSFTFKIGSLIDTNPSDYVAICNQYGDIIGHEYNGKEFKHEQQAEEIIEETKNVNQLNLFQ